MVTEVVKAIGLKKFPPDVVEDNNAQGWRPTCLIGCA